MVISESGLSPPVARRSRVWEIAGDGGAGAAEQPDLGIAQFCPLILSETMAASFLPLLAPSGLLNEAAKPWDTDKNCLSHEDAVLGRETRRMKTST